MEYRGLALFRLCEIRASLGETEPARDACGRLVRLWSDADAVLQPAVDEARSRLERLRE